MWPVQWREQRRQRGQLGPCQQRLRVLRASTGSTTEHPFGVRRWAGAPKKGPNPRPAPTCPGGRPARLLRVTDDGAGFSQPSLVTGARLLRCLLPMCSAPTGHCPAGPPPISLTDLWELFAYSEGRRDAAFSWGPLGPPWRVPGKGGRCVQVSRCPRHTRTLPAPRGPTVPEDGAPVGGSPRQACPHPLRPGRACFTRTEKSTLPVAGGVLWMAPKGSWLALPGMEEDGKTSAVPWEPSPRPRAKAPTTIPPLPSVPHLFSLPPPTVMMVTKA